jgi:hypothetical protein
MPGNSGGGAAAPGGVGAAGSDEDNMAFAQGLEALDRVDVLLTEIGLRMTMVSGAW